MAVSGASLTGMTADDTLAAWDQWRGPNRNSIIEGQPFPASIAHNDLKLDWRVELEPSYSSPIVVGDRVFTTETINKERESTRAFNRLTGELIWEQSWEGAMKVPFYAASNGSWIRSTPAWSDGYLYVGGMRDVLKCLNASNGEVVWSRDFPSEWNTDLPSFGFVSSPIVEGDSLIVQAGAAVVCLDKKSGEILWKTLEDDGGTSDSAFSSPVIAEIHGQRQLVVQTREELAGVDLSNGDVLWKQEVPSYRGMNILTPLVIGNSVFTSSYKNKSWLYEIDKSSEGEWSVSEKWMARSPAYMSSPVLIEGHIYMHLQSQRVQCLDAATGESKWISDRSFGKYWSMIASGDRILALDEQGILYLLKPSPDEFLLLQERKIADGDSWAHLSMYGNQIFVRELRALSAFSFDPRRDLALD